MKKKKLLLTGASGTIGRELFRELIFQKFEITLLLRPSRKNIRQFKSFKNVIDIIWGNIQNSEDVNKAVLNKDIIVHAAGVLPDISMFEPDLAKLTNIGGTINILNAMKNQKIIPKIIYTSSTAVYGKNLENPMIRISDPVFKNPKDTYTFTKTWTGDITKDNSMIIASVFDKDTDYAVQTASAEPVDTSSDDIFIIPDGYSDTPPDWATCSFVGVLGVTDQMGKPLPPSHAVVGYCQDNFKGRLVGAIAELNEKEPVGYIGTYVIGRFLLGKMGISNENQTLIIGIGGRNETHFYFRTMAIVGPTFYVTGIYLQL